LSGSKPLWASSGPFGRPSQGLVYCYGLLEVLPVLGNCLVGTVSSEHVIEALNTVCMLEISLGWGAMGCGEGHLLGKCGLAFAKRY
jgi:hypothetical protein